MKKIAFINHVKHTEVVEFDKSDLCRVPVKGEEVILTINGSEKDCTILKVTHWLEKGDVICEYTRG